MQSKTIKITELTFAYENGYENIFENVSFSLNTDWRLGFCGRNGRGKTTFLNLLLGKFEYRGHIEADVDFEYFPYEISDENADTIDILTHIVPDAQLWQIQRELSKLAVSEDVLHRPFSTLSNGERTKTLLTALFLRENTFLLIDEPTNHLDMNARELVARYLASKSGFILVSHDRAFLDACTDHTLSINKANIEIIGGNFSVWYEQKQRNDAFELAQNEKLSDEIERLKIAAERTANWAEKTEKSKHIKPKSGNAIDTGFVGHKSAKMMKRAISAKKRQFSAIEEKSKLLKNLETADNIKLIPAEYFAERLISAYKFSVNYGKKPIFGGVTFDINAGDRVGLIGGNGSGKSSIIKAILGENIPFSGDLRIGSRLKISYVPQDTSFLAGNLSDYAEMCGIDETLFKSMLRKLDFSRSQFEKDMSEFSEGQRKKTLIARSLCENAHLYIWDEPLNFIDIYARGQVEDLILRYKPTLLFVEHDKFFTETVATKTVKLRDEL